MKTKNFIKEDIDRNPLKGIKVQPFLRNKNKKPDIISSKKFDDREENRLIRRSFDISKRCAKEIKLRAITEGIKDYDVVQRALNRYFGFDEGEKDD